MLGILTTKVGEARCAARFTCTTHKHGGGDWAAMRCVVLARELSLLDKVPHARCAHFGGKIERALWCVQAVRKNELWRWWWWELDMLGRQPASKGARLWRVAKVVGKTIIRYTKVAFNKKMLKLIAQTPRSNHTHIKPCDVLTIELLKERIQLK